MFELGSWGEILIIAIAGLILIGPKELPDVLRTCGRWFYRLRRISIQLREGLHTFIEEGQLEEFEHTARKTAEKMNQPKKEWSEATKEDGNKTV